MSKTFQSQIILNGILTSDLLEEFRKIVREEISNIPKPEKIKPYMSLDDLEELTGWSKSFIYKGTSTGKIPHIKRGGKLLFNREEIIKWLEEARQPILK